jgi:hypothetical protein
MSNLYTLTKLVILSAGASPAFPRENNGAGDVWDLTGLLFTLNQAFNNFVVMVITDRIITKYANREL